MLPWFHRSNANIQTQVLFSILSSVLCAPPPSHEKVVVVSNFTKTLDVIAHFLTLNK
jgi:SNF2 family DNA or RNA helicase